MGILTNIIPINKRKPKVPIEDAELADIIDRLAADDAKYHARHQAAFDATETAKANRSKAYGLKRADEAEAAKYGKLLTEDRSAALQRACEAADRAVAAAQDESGNVSTAANTARRVLNNTVAYIDVTAKGSTLNKEPVDLPHGHLLDVIELQQLAIDGFVMERGNVKKSWLPMQEEIETVIRQRVELAAGPAVEVSWGGHTPKLVFPVQIVRGAEPTSGYLPVVADVTPLLARQFADVLDADIRKAVEERYARAGDRLIMTAAEKLNRLADIADTILEAQRVLAAAVWQAKAAGLDVSFPADIDPRAVLGVRGPAPKRGQAEQDEEDTIDGV